MGLTAWIQSSGIYSPPPWPCGPILGYWQLAQMAVCSTLRSHDHNLRFCQKPHLPRFSSKNHPIAYNKSAEQPHCFLNNQDSCFNYHHRKGGLVIWWPVLQPSQPMTVIARLNCRRNSRTTCSEQPTLKKSQLFSIKRDKHPGAYSHLIFLYTPRTHSTSPFFITFV